MPHGGGRAAPQRPVPRQHRPNLQAPRSGPKHPRPEQNHRPGLRERDDHAEGRHAANGLHHAGRRERGQTAQHIKTVGFDYFDKSEINDLRVANEQNKLGLVIDQNENPTEKSVEELFQKIENWTDIIQTNPEEMRSLPTYRNYLAWYNRLKIGFVSVCDIPNYDLKANEKLGALIKEAETVKFS